MKPVPADVILRLRREASEHLSKKKEHPEQTSLRALCHAFLDQHKINC